MEITGEVLEEAAARFGLNWFSLRFLGGMDGAVYETQQDSPSFVLKLEPVTLDKLQQVREKFEFIAYLGEHGLRVPLPLPSRQGNLVEIISSRNSLFAATQSHKAPGRHVGADHPGEWTPALFQAWGSVMGRMHRLARAYPYWRRPPVKRTRINLDTTLQDWRMEHSSFAASCPDETVRERWLGMGQLLETLPVERKGYGLIHNDLHPWNFLVDGGSLTVIDFDVCCYHWFITDIAIAVYHACWGEINERPDNRQSFASSFLAEFMSGYRQEYDLDRSWLDYLPNFIRYREMLLFMAFSSSWPEPRKSWQSRMITQLHRQILEKGQSLASLFE